MFFLLIFFNTHAMSEAELEKCRRINKLIRQVEKLYRQGQLAEAVTTLKKDPKEIIINLMSGDDGRKNIARKLLSRPDAADIILDIDLADYQNHIPINHLHKTVARDHFFLTKITQRLPSTITKLILSSNKLQELSTLVLPEALVELDLAENEITTINLNSLKHLELLWLDDNRISSVDQTMLPTSLKRLELKRNRLTGQPDLRRLTNLEVLNLSGNHEISSFDEHLLPLTLTALQLHALTRLEELIITRLPHLTQFAANDLTSLRKLEISHAKIAFLHLVDATVKQLILAHNRFERLGAAYGHGRIPPSVEHLDLSNNPLKALNVHNLYNLRELNLAHTDLSWHKKLMWYYKVYHMRSAYDLEQGNHIRFLFNPINVSLIAGLGLAVYADWDIASRTTIPAGMYALYRLTRPRDNQTT